jgi:hypothetical protein
VETPISLHEHRVRNRDAPILHLSAARLIVQLQSQSEVRRILGEVSDMTHSLGEAEQMVRQLIDDTNRSQHEPTWRYELTSDVDNIEVATDGGMHTLRIHPCWLRFVVTQGDFKSCVADEIAAWRLLAELTGSAA